MTAPLELNKTKTCYITDFMQTVQINKDLDCRFLRGVDINQKDKLGCTALHWAVHHGNLHNIKLLLEYGSHLETSKGMNALFCAVLYNKMEVLRYFIKKGFDINMEYDGLTLLEYAKRLERVEIIEYLKRVQKDTVCFL